MTRIYCCSRYIQHTPIHIRTHRSARYAHTRTHTHTNILACTHAHGHTHTLTHTCTHSYTGTCTQAYMQTYTCTYMQMHIYYVVTFHRPWQQWWTQINSCILSYIGSDWRTGSARKLKRKPVSKMEILCISRGGRVDWSLPNSTNI